MRLSRLAARLDVVQRQGAADVEIASATGDSRRVEPGALFAAIPGTQADGHRFIHAAIQAGARAVILQRWPGGPWPEDVAGLLVPDPRRALAQAACALHGDPALSMTTFGLTGTNGKTTGTFILASILRAWGRRAGLVGTTGVGWDGPDGPAWHEATHTTPDGPALFGWLARMRDDGVGGVALELSSHALDQGRAAGLQLDVAAWSNLSRDHLDYHGTEAAYEAAKARILTEWLGRWGKPGCTAVLFADDPAVARHAGDWPRTLRVSARPGSGADVAPDEPPRFSMDGCEVPISTPAGRVHLRSRLPGPHNLANSLLAVGCAVAAGVEIGAIERGLAETRGAPGRLERVEAASGRGPRVLVDYAHSPHAVAEVLAALRPLAEGRILIVLGCGGDRDRGKRPQMGQAALAADVVILTSDNPRSEDPEAILDEIEAPLRLAGADYLRIPCRREAIREAILRASDRDVVLIAGKGHESWQEVSGQRLPFDDRVEAARALETL